MKPRLRSTNMRSTSKSKIQGIVASNHWTRIGESERAALLVLIPDLTSADLKRIDIPVDEPWQGVNQKTFDDLESSLVAFCEIYSSRPDLRPFCRREVIRAKDHARLASRNRHSSEEKRRVKSEMVEWMLIWLDDPAIFPTWVQLRRQKLEPNMLSKAVMNEDRVKCDVCHGSGQCTACKGTGNGGQCFICAGTGHCPQCQGTGKRKAANVG